MILKRLFTALICSILISFLLGIFITSMYDYGYYLFFLFLIYLILGIPISFLIDRLVNEYLSYQNRYLNFLFSLVLYTMFGIFIGFVLGNFLPHSGFTSSLFKFYLQTGAICSVSFYIILNILEVTIKLSRLLIKEYFN